MTNWIRKAVLLLGLALLVAPYAGGASAMEDYPRTSSWSTFCAMRADDPDISDLEKYGCDKRSSESGRHEFCLPVWNDERQTRERVCSFLG